MKRPMALAITLLLAGCANMATQEEFKRQADMWIGSNVDDLILKLGPPTSTAYLSDGKRVLQWARSQTSVSGGGSVPVTAPVLVNGNWGQTTQQRSMPVSSSTIECTLNVAVSQKNIIQSWTADGNGCIARPPKTAAK